MDDSVTVVGDNRVFYVKDREKLKNNEWVYHLKSPTDIKSAVCCFESSLIDAEPQFKKGEIVIVTENEPGFHGEWEIYLHPSRLYNTGKWWYVLTRPGVPFYISTVLTISEERLSKAPSRDRIPVPENIKIYSSHHFKGIASPNGKLLLTVMEMLPSACYIRAEIEKRIPNDKLCLVPCKRSDLKPGDIAFRGIKGVPPDLQEFTIHHQYCVILNKDESAYWYNEMDMKVDGICGGVFWYKVIFE